MFAPIVAGVVFGTKSVTGLLAGGIASGVQMAVSASNTGGAWDNAKKYIGKGGLNDLIARVEPDVVNELGDVKQKKSQIYKAAVTGDTVGDPLKDTSGPALNIMMKLMAIISVVFAPLFLAIKDGDGLLGFVVHDKDVAAAHDAVVAATRRLAQVPVASPAGGGELVAMAFGLVVGVGGVLAVQRATAPPRAKAAKPALVCRAAKVEGTPVEPRLLAHTASLA